jgi:N-acetylglucosamine malate deacetylase 2
MSQHNSAQQALAWFSSVSSSRADAPRTVLLAAHPDDETIGASAALYRLPDVTVAYLTDGAPRDTRLRSPHVNGSRDFYACVRAEEAASALAIAGVPASRIVFLGGVDQEAIAEAPRLLEGFLDVIRRCQPSVVITHPYEGGHPDHDTAALIAQLALPIMSGEAVAVPALLEMTSYHGRDGRRASGEFLPTNARGSYESVTLSLTPEERTMKARMFGSYVSQWHILSEFPLEPERLRAAPVYDFSRPPHDGQLWYEYLNWPTTNALWREAAKKLLERYGHVSCH